MGGKEGRGGREGGRKRGKARGRGREGGRNGGTAVQKGVAEDQCQARLVYCYTRMDTDMSDM